MLNLKDNVTKKLLIFKLQLIYLGLFDVVIENENM